MKKLCFNLVAFLCFSFVATSTFAQFSTPAPSPSAKIKQAVGLTEVVIEYSRPSMKGRNIFSAEGLVPHGKVWRTGANAATKISFDKDVQVGGKDLKAGAYAILTKPAAASWEVMFFPYESGSWSSYVEKKPAATISAEATALPFSVESFTIMVGDLTNNSATIGVMWDKTYVAIPLAVHTGKQVMAAFDKMKAGPSAGEYYNMGMYMASQGKDLETALKYVQKVTKAKDAKFWQLHQEAKILAKLGKAAEAKAVAEKSIALAKEAGNSDYVALNEKLISSMD